MIRPTGTKAWLAIAIVAALSAVPAVASAAAPASDEYVLEIPGVRQTDTGPVANATPATDAGDGVQRGVVGEQETSSAPLAVLGDALSGFPVAYTVGLAALAAIAALGLSRRRPIVHGPR